MTTMDLFDEFEQSEDHDVAFHNWVDSDETARQRFAGTDAYDDAFETWKRARVMKWLGA